MNVHGCASRGARFPTYAGLQEHLLTHRTFCHTCNRAFTRRANLLKHKCVSAGDPSCESCRRTFSTRHTLKRHLRETSCSQPPPPEPKRQRVSVREEDSDDLIEPPPQEDSDLQDVLIEHWSSIRLHVERGPIQTRYNFRLKSMATRALDLRRIFQFTFYQQQNIDMCKDGISVPGLTLLYLFNDLPPNMFFTVFSQTTKDLHHLIKDNIVDGPAIISHRYHEKNVTNIRA